MATVRYFVQDVDRSVSFYSDLLGFAVVERWGAAFAMVEKEGLQLWLSGPQSSAARPMPDGSQPTPGGWNRIVIAVPHIERAVDELRKAGAKFRNDVISGPGGQQVVLDDPDGNPIEIFQPRG